ncbi:MAG: hypothetical protein HN899_17870 [Gemmatimonadales bacterium]|nr:hypothetical protein [Gemmatimonadales bacterium]MBT3958917.1 hypothetical protein [Gemmatimonadales bacterium]MBT6888176.1 hypothetical protein [Gemmatimonadales bacterium]MBT7127014.1 hypothetical protein [Gemmatimonadales bacterium]
MSGLRVVSLFLGYSVIGLGGDYDVQVHVDPEIVVDVQVRQGSGDCSYEMTREFSLDVSAGTSLTLEEIAGKLSIEGREGLDHVEVVGQLCASSEERLREMSVSSEVEGNEIIISAHYAENRSNWRGNSAKIDLTVYVPVGMDVEIEEAAGSIRSSGTGNLLIGDAAGSISIKDVAGDLQINDGAGSVTIDDIEGTVTVDDVAGSLRISDIGLSVMVGDVAGSVSVQNVGGDLTVDGIAGGRVSHSGVEGKVDVPEDERRRRRRGGN